MTAIDANKLSERQMAAISAHYVVGVDPECWPWTGEIKRRGYGRIRLTIDGRGRWYRAHRLVWVLSGRSLPEGLTLDHLCRNRRCVNPSHLEPVDNRTNILRGCGASARNLRKTHCVNGHEFSPENTSLDLVRGRPSRRCRACSRIKSLRRYYAGRRAVAA